MKVNGVTKNQHLILEFVLLCQWVTYNSVRLFFKNDKGNTSKMLKALVKKGMLVESKVTLNYSNPINVYFLTAHGLGLVADFDTMMKHKYVNANRIFKNQFNHSVNCHIVMALCTLNGFKNLVNPDYNMRKKGEHLSDLICEKDGKKYYIEVELSIKYIKRYISIFTDFFKKIVDGEIDYVVYTSSDVNVIRKVEYIFNGFKEFMYKGKLVVIENKIKDRFLFVEYDFFLEDETNEIK